MEIVEKAPKQQRNLEAASLEYGVVYRLESDQEFVMKVHLGPAGSRIVYLKNGKMLNNPHHQRYTKAKAKLVVS